jgi:hypothetical protein
MRTRLTDGRGVASSPSVWGSIRRKRMWELCVGMQLDSDYSSSYGSRHIPRRNESPARASRERPEQTDRFHPHQCSLLSLRPTRVSIFSNYVWIPNRPDLLRHQRSDDPVKTRPPSLHCKQNTHIQERRRKRTNDERRTKRVTCREREREHSNVCEGV